MADIVEEAAGAQCLIVGDGEERLALENLARALNVKDAVHFIASDPDTAKFLAVIDIFVFPSANEGSAWRYWRPWPRQGLCGLRHRGIRDIIQNASYGTLVPVAISGRSRTP